MLYNYEEPDKPIIVTNYHILKRSDVYVNVTADTSLLNTMNKRKINSLVYQNTTWFRRGTRIYTKFITGYPTKPNFVCHPDTSIDLAAFTINLGTSMELETGEKVKTNVAGIPISAIKGKENVALGDEVYFLGFPWSYGANEKITPIIRSGSIACFNPNGNEFLLDAFSFGGNSGSPIFSKRIISSPGNLQWENSKLIGMVYGHHGIQDVLVKPDLQSNDLKIVITEIQNMGLVRCIWSDEIIRVAKLLTKQK